MNDAIAFARARPLTTADAPPATKANWVAAKVAENQDATGR